MKYYSILNYLSNKILFANSYKHCLDKFENVSEVSLTLRQILNNIRFNKHPNNFTIFRYT